MFIKVYIGVWIELELYVVIIVNVYENGILIFEEVNIFLSWGLNLFEEENDGRG